MADPARTSIKRGRRALSRERILRAAVRLVDEQGLDALTMRRLGGRLGVEAMAIYKHLPSKDALLDGMVEVVAGELQLASADDEDWRRVLHDLAHQTRRLAHAHPNVFPLIAMRPLNSAAALEPVEAVFKALAEGGFEGQTALQAWRTYAGYVIGSIVNELGGHFGETPGTDGTHLDVTQLPEERFPCLKRIASHILTSDAEREFEFGLEVVVNGLCSTLSPGGSNGAG